MKYLISDTDRHGNTRVYVRVPGTPKIRLRGKPGTEAFAVEYLRAVRGETCPPEKPVRKVVPKAPTPGYVYFVKAGESVKIGFSVDVRGRIKSMQTASSRPMILLLVLPGTTADEAALHRRFAHLRTVGEWFGAGQDLLDFVRESRAAQNWSPLPAKAKSRTKMSHLG